MERHHSEKNPLGDFGKLGVRQSSLPRFSSTDARSDGGNRMNPKRIALESMFQKSGPNEVRVCRPSRYGNPYVIGKDGDRETVLRKFEVYLREKLLEHPCWLVPLRGKDLICFCPLDEHCHADILLTYANLPLPPWQDCCPEHVYRMLYSNGWCMECGARVTQPRPKGVMNQIIQAAVKKATTK
jgi:hypothetical protein